MNLKASKGLIFILLTSFYESDLAYGQSQESRKFKFAMTTLIFYLKENKAEKLSTFSIKLCNFTEY